MISLAGRRVGFLDQFFGYHVHDCGSHDMYEIAIAAADVIELIVIDLVGSRDVLALADHVAFPSVCLAGLSPRTLV
jgi:hypothetical protein